MHDFIFFSNRKRKDAENKSVFIVLLTRELYSVDMKIKKL